MSFISTNDGITTSLYHTVGIDMDVGSVDSFTVSTPIAWIYKGEWVVFGKKKSGPFLTCTLP